MTPSPSSRTNTETTYASHQERIICPSCKKEVTATVEHTWPFYSYVHFCECGYTIMESEWEKVKT